MDMPVEHLPDVADAKVADRHEALEVGEHPLAAAIVSAGRPRLVLWRNSGGPLRIMCIVSMAIRMRAQSKDLNQIIGRTMRLLADGPA